MAFPYVTNDITDVIDSLSRLEEPFYITGERFFISDYTPNRWEFMAEYSEQLFTKLKEIGFMEVELSSGDDPFILQKLKIRSNENFVYVYLVKNVLLRFDIQYILRDKCSPSFFNEVENPFRKQMWEAMYELHTQTLHNIASQE